MSSNSESKISSPLDIAIASANNSSTSINLSSFFDACETNLPQLLPESACEVKTTVLKKLPRAARYPNIHFVSNNKDPQQKG
ncbi:hypothetical protein Mapa_005673 [Marchantia paleacea]|nr:hypothetical protein Mapa_005673 [Marchantia paleacea]